MSGKNCKARQQSDQMTCVCGLAWDVNDVDPPECRNNPPETKPQAKSRHREVALKYLRALHETLAFKPGDPK